MMGLIIFQVNVLVEDGIRQYAINLLQRELLPAFTYHNVSHMLDVVNYCNRLAELEEIDEERRSLLLVAAYFHDAGLIAISSKDISAFEAGQPVHEEKAVQIASEILPTFGFGVKEIEIIARLIMATKWGHMPEDVLEQIISDADISSIGFATDEFMRTSEALLAELRAFGMEITEIDWYENQKELLETHIFHTASAHNLLDPNRLLNAIAVQSRLNTLTS
jgi:predicted metal-dependent HD superfamily phosphohydrolase